MRRTLDGAILVVFALGVALSGCAAGPLGDRLPSDLGGLPAGAPARPTTTYQYPAVHDMPPPRSTKTMSEEEQVRLEKELQAVRDRQESRPGAAKKEAPAAKKQPTDAKAGQSGGARGNP
jgi:hypothetical protein